MDYKVSSEGNAKREKKRGGRQPGSKITVRAITEEGMG